MTQTTQTEKNIFKDQSELDSLQRQILNRSIRSYREKGSDNWFLFCTFYIEATGRLVDALPNKSIDFSEFSHERALIVPSYFLFKHTLELVLKRIFISIRQKNVNTHDPSEIISQLKYKELSSKLKYTDIAKAFKTDEGEIKKLSSDCFKELIELSDRYLFHMGILDTIKKGNFFLVDQENELFRYPKTNKVGFQIDPLNLYEISQKEIDGLKRDFRTLKKNFNFLNAFLDISESP